MATTATCTCCPAGQLNHVTLPVLRRAQAAEHKAREVTETAEAAVDNWQVARRKIVHKRLVLVAVVLAGLLLLGTGHWLMLTLIVLGCAWARHSWRQTRYGRAVRARQRTSSTRNRRTGKRHAAAKPAHKPGSQADLAVRISNRIRAYELHEEALLALTDAEKNCPAAWRFPELDERTAARVDAEERINREGVA